MIPTLAEVLAAFDKLRQSIAAFSVARDTEETDKAVFDDILAKFLGEGDRDQKLAALLAAPTDALAAAVAANQSSTPSPQEK